MTLFPTELDELQSKVSILELEREFHLLRIRRLEHFAEMVLNGDPTWRNAYEETVDGNQN